MAELQSVSQLLSVLSISPAHKVSHAATTSDAEWRKALDGASGAPEKFELVKTLVYKPKTAKTATAVPVVVVTREDTQANSGALGKKLNLKELRLASDDLLQEFFALDKNSRK
jgi:prolyl-tRNA synthetase